MKSATTTAHANIALIKYWGKRDDNLFLPTKSSLSITLNNLSTETTVCIQPSPCAKATGDPSRRPTGSSGRAAGIAKNNFDTIRIDQKLLDQEQKKNIVRFLDIFRDLYNKKDYFDITSTNNFPTAAGLASSSSGFAALAKGLNQLYNLQLSNKELSILARRGSGSACRSIYDGFVIWHKGEKPDGSDSYAEQLFGPNHWPEFRIIIAAVDESEKRVSSRVGMQRTVETSPNYYKWVENSEARLPKMIKAIKNKDIKAVGELAEQDCLEMHECMKKATPPLNYWQPGTKKIIEKVRNLRASGIPCYFTIDAGPNVKIITLDQYSQFVSPLSADGAPF